MRGFRTALVIAAAWTLVVAGPASAATTWHVVNSPNPGKDGPYVSRGFTEVTAASANRVWAAGFAHGPIIARWNGSAWHLDDLPRTNDNYFLSGIDTNGTAVWAVGGDSSGPIALHLVAGTWQFKRITGAPSGTTLRDLSVISNSNVWAVGNDGTAPAAALHWNGSSWSSKPPPVPAGASGVQLNKVETIRGTTKVMADGYYVKSGQFFPYAVQWTGSAWKVQTTPTSPFGEFIGLVVRSASNAWAVGETDPTHDNVKTLIDHWNGTRWSRVASPNRTAGDVLLSVDAKSNRDIWAVGYTYVCTTTTCSKFRTLALHYNGSKWAVGTSANPSTSLDMLVGTSFVPGTSQFWAVGTEGPARPGLTAEFTLTEHCTC